MRNFGKNFLILKYHEKNGSSATGQHTEFCQSPAPVFFNRGSAEPSGSADLFQGFRDVPGKEAKVTQENGRNHVRQHGSSAAILNLLHVRIWIFCHECDQTQEARTTVIR